jgi:hypothetical protein
VTPVEYDLQILFSEDRNPSGQRSQLMILLNGFNCITSDLASKFLFANVKTEENHCTDTRFRPLRKDREGSGSNILNLCI